jgi:hypothetical protein
MKKTSVKRLKASGTIPAASELNPSGYPYTCKLTSSLYFAIYQSLFSSYAQGSDVDSILHDLCSIMFEDTCKQSSTSGPQAVAESSQPLLSPKLAMTRFPGKDIKTLCNLAVALARDCVLVHKLCKNLPPVVEVQAE